MAMPKLPEDVELKLRHATRHLQTLNAQMHSFGDRDPYSDVAELHIYSGQRGRVVMRMVVNREPRVDVPRARLDTGKGALR